MPATIPPTDLTQRPPRSLRCRLGGYAILPRALDKGRAELIDKGGEYHYNCPLDQQFFTFAGIDSEALKAQLAAGLGDGEILKWIEATSTTKCSAWEILQWSAWQNDRFPSDTESREFFHGIHKAVAPERGDIATWADLLDADDFASFGGKV